MVQSFNKFCGGSPLFDSDRLLNNSYPEFTDCFQNTLLVWVPCGLVWLILPLYLRFLLTREDAPLPLSFRNVAKTFFSLILFVLTGVELLNAGNLEENLEPIEVEKYPDAYFVAGSIKAATFLLVALLIQIERLRGVITSGVLFIFWFLMSLAGIIPFYTLIIQKKYEKDGLFSFVLFYISYAILLIQLVLTSFAEQTQRRGYERIGREGQCPEVTASFPSKLTFNWITSLVITGFRKGIEEDDLWNLHPRDQSENFIPKFEQAWKNEVQKQKKIQEAKSRKTRVYTDDLTPLLNSHSSKNGKKYDPQLKEQKKEEKKKGGASVFKVLVRVFGRSLFTSWCFKFIYDLLQFVSPMILNELIGYVESKNMPGGHEYAWKGYVFALGLFVVAITQSVFFHQNFHFGMTTGMRIKSSLIGSVYKKALTMNSEARKTSTVGEIVNLMSVDCQRIQDITGYLWMLWSAPVQITLALVLLWNTIGVSVLAGLAIMILMMPLNAVIAMKQRKLQVAQMRFKDGRIKLMNEVLNGIKVLKLYAWEPSFEKKVAEIRDKELNNLKKNAYLNAVSTFFWTSAPFLVTLATFATYVLVDESHYLDAQKAFVSLSLFAILRFPINLLPMIISYVVQGSVSLGRIGRFLESDDLDPDNVINSATAPHAIAVDRATFSWGKDDEPTLRNIDLDVPDGQLVAVVGQVGSGKSSLISAFLGEMEKLQGTVTVKGSVAYVPQQAWIQNATVRSNILFGKEVDQNKYNQVIEACALGPDLEILQGGDLTEIGEKGINLSGGQKQRVSLARSVYNNADIYLLDDPLSAVDSHVGKHIFQKVIGSKGLLRNKTRVLVTHGVHWLPMVDTIVVMVDGQISEYGSYDELLSHDGAFAQFLKMYLTQDNEDDDDEDPEVQQMKSKILERVDSVTSGTEGTTGLSGEDDIVPRLKPRRPSKTAGEKRKLMARSISAIDEEGGKGKWEEKKEKKADKLIEAEKSETGKVSWKVYLKYFKAIGGISTFFIFGLFILYNAGGIVSNIWLSQWTDDKLLRNTTLANTTEYQDKNYMYLGVYAALGIGQAAVILFYALLAAVRMVRAAGTLHAGMLTNILKLPMAFFDTTPLGRIVNRFSRDVETIDNNLPQNLRMFLNTFFGALSVFVVISYSTPLFLTIILPMAILYYLVQRFYIPTSRQLKRIESTTRSPIYSHFGESIAGASTIRGYRLQQEFITHSRNQVDKNLVFYFAGIASNRWLGFRLELLGNLIVFAAAMFAVLTPSTTGGLAGLSISYALQVTGALNFLVRNSSDMETNIVSVERVKEYSEATREVTATLNYLVRMASDLETQIVSVERVEEFTKLEREADWILHFQRPPHGWPQHGNVRFNNYSVRYREGLDLVLRGITCEIMGGERVGIVGRTGAGKSSLTVGLFRLIEAAGGNIVIDGQKISDMGLHDLRSKLTILPQDPVLFSGTLRMNLDPFDTYTDAQVWRALEHAHLKTFVSGLNDGLQHECGEGGQNLSVGQRQLVCLARTLLRKTKILILDEATAAVDMETDDLIQKTIREEFKDCTILTIAHRLNTIMDYDKIVVLDQGLIKEFDSPENLLKNKSSVFYAMAKDANLV